MTNEELCEECNTFKSQKHRKPMKHALRAGLGFVGGMSFLLGLLSLVSGQFYLMIVGVIAVVIGLLAFYYGYKG